MHDRPDVDEALRLLALPQGAAEWPDARRVDALCKRLKKDKEFSYARRLCARSRQLGIDDPEVRRRFRQQHALCTYKDSDLASEEGLHDALAILDSDPTDRLATTSDQETLGIAGAIHKRRWDVDARLGHLERARAFYERGFQEGPGKDLGYTGINAAFVLDLLADQEEKIADETGTPPNGEAQRHRDRARQIREELLRVVGPLEREPRHTGLAEDWWYLVTMGEAHFGLGQFERRHGGCGGHAGSLRRTGSSSRRRVSSSPWRASRRATRIFQPSPIRRQ